MNWMIVQQIQNGVLSKISYRVVGKKPGVFLSSKGR